MLRACRKGNAEGGRYLTGEEDQALRLAFGRLAEPAARAAGAAVVRRYQHAGYGNWLLCDCLGDGPRPPALIPVMETYIRRHTDPSWPAHADGCDFAREPAEQRMITRSFSLPPVGPMQLVRGFATAAEDATPRPPEIRCFNRRREALATMLMRLMTDAGLTIVSSDKPPMRLGDQFKALRAAARGVELDRDVSLASYLCTYLPALPEMMARIEAAPASRFRRTRPHGVLLAVVTGTGRGNLIVDDKTSLPVRGRISVFGERDGNGRDIPAERSARAPYLAACLVGRPAATQPATVLRAYVHPRVSTRDLMLVDSDNERRTLAQLLKLQRWLRERLRIRLEIEKPLFDIGEDTSGEDAQPREPCIPDFILRADHVRPGGAATVVIETMGYADDVYRARKARMHGLMSQVLGGAPVVRHDCHLPSDQPREERDRRFWLTTRWTVSGPDAEIQKPRPSARVTASSDTVTEGPPRDTYPRVMDWPRESITNNE